LIILPLLLRALFGEKLKKLRAEIEPRLFASARWLTKVQSSLLRADKRTQDEVDRWDSLPLGRSC
jgi:hypothetical protein